MIQGKLFITINKQKSGFGDYLEETENTICGRHPIAVLLNVLIQFSS